MTIAYRVGGHGSALNLGYHVYGLGALWLGTVGLTWGDFALTWQPVPADVPGRTALAYAAGLVLAVAGGVLTVAGNAAAARRAAARAAGLLTTFFVLVVLLLHVPRALAAPLHLSPWAGLAEQVALAVGGWLSVLACADLEAARAEPLARTGRVVFGVCALLFGAVHFRFAAATAALVPHWLPPGPLFWVYVTGVADVAAGLAILAGVRARLAASLLTAMFLVFALLVHAPLAIAHPHSHLSWTMSAMNLALAGAAWVVADSLRREPRGWSAFR